MIPRQSQPRLPILGSLLLALTVGVVLWTMVLVVTGGIDLRGVGIRFSSRDPFRPACVAAVLILVYTATFRTEARIRLWAMRTAAERWGLLFAIAASLYMLVVALRFGSHVAAGSDPYGYVSQADLWLAGRLTVPQPLAREVPWPLADWTFAPLGYRPALGGGVIVPTYPSGLPLLMALAKLLVGACGPYLVVPLLGALMVWLTYCLGTRLASRSVGVAAACLVAASPAFVSQVLRPMTDVPVAALLLAAVVIMLSNVRGPRQRIRSTASASECESESRSRFESTVGLESTAGFESTSSSNSNADPDVASHADRDAASHVDLAAATHADRDANTDSDAMSDAGLGVKPALLAASTASTNQPPRRSKDLLTGLVLSLALLVRPNLAPLAVLFVGFVSLRAQGWRDRVTRTLLLVMGLLPGLVAIAAIHTHLYGAPWQSGYGDLGGLYAWRYARTNLIRYPAWLIETQTPLILAAFLPLLASHRRRRRASTSHPTRRPSPLWFLGALTAAIWLSYLFYLPFDDWGYLRFVLASFPFLLVLAVLGWQLAASRLRWESRAALVLALFLVVLGFEVGRVQNFVILGRWKGECSDISVAEFVDHTLPPNAVIVSVHYSGSLRHYAHRLTLRYDWLDREWLPRALDVLTAKGYHPFIVLTDWEEADFRQRFGLADHSVNHVDAADPASAVSPAAAVESLTPPNAKHPSKVVIAASAGHLETAARLRNASPAASATDIATTASIEHAPGLIVAELGHPARARIYDPLASLDPSSRSAPPPMQIAPGAPCPCMLARSR